MSHQPYTQRIARRVGYEPDDGNANPRRLRSYKKALEAVVDSIDELLLQTDDETPPAELPYDTRLSAADVTEVLFGMGFGYRTDPDYPTAR